MYQLSFDHIHYRTQSFEETKKFYMEVMGAINVGEVELGKDGVLKPNLQLELGGAMLLFAEDASELKTNEDCEAPCVVPPWSSRHGVYHIAMLVDDIVKATEFFRQKAIEVYGTDKDFVLLGPFNAGGNIWASFLNAPDGMAIELKEIRVQA